MPAGDARSFGFCGHRFRVKIPRWVACVCCTVIQSRDRQYMQRGKADDVLELLFFLDYHNHQRFLLLGEKYATLTPISAHDKLVESGDMTAMFLVIGFLEVRKFKTSVGDV